MTKVRLPLAALLAPLALGILLHGDRARADLALDPTFDTDGIAQVDVTPSFDLARHIAVQQNGALVLAGRSRQVAGAASVDYATVVRLNGTTGAPDATFGTGGIAAFLPGQGPVDDGYGAEVRGLALQPADQKIIVAGSWKAKATDESQVFVARLDTTGALDPSFGTAGVVLFTPAGITTPFPNAIGLRSDGSVIIVGSGTADGASVGFVAGVDTDGLAIAGFTDALVTNPLPAGGDFGFNAVAILSGDRILAGGGGGDLALAQFTSTGAPDGSFGTAGIASFNFFSFDTAEGANPTYDVVTALTVLDDGRILMAGRASASASANSYNRILGRVTAAGILDSTFGSGGYVPLADLGADEVPLTVAVRPSGDIVLAGQGFDPVQISPDGIAQSIFTGAFDVIVTDLQVLGTGDLVGSGQIHLTATNTAFAAVRFTATDLPDGTDRVPDPFVFPTQTGLETDFTATSSPVTITGLAAPARISISSATGDQYSVGCSVYTSAPGTISNGQTVCVRAVSSPNGTTAKRAFLTIGGVPGVTPGPDTLTVTGQFTLVTGDATPDAFTFVDQVDVAPGAVVTSAPVTLTGFAIRTGVSVTGAGAYSVGCTGTYTTSPGTADPGATVCLQHTASPTPGGFRATTLRVGKGTLVTDEFSSQTAGDITPDAFSFVDQTGVARSTVITSAPVTLTGFTSPASIAVTGGTYSIGCTGTYTSATGTVAPDSQVCVRHTSSASGGTVVSTTLTVGAAADVVARSATFRSTTEGTQDTTPDAFTFPAQTGVPLATVITSGVITIGGFDTNTTVSVIGGTYSLGCGTQFTSVAQSIAPNTSVCVRQTSASIGGTATSTILTVGGVSGTFTSTTIPGDAVPAAFGFVDRTDVDLYAITVSAPVTITGINIASPIVVTGGEYSIGCTSTFTSGAGSITNGQTVCVRHRSSFNSSTAVDTTLTVGNVSDTFTSTTKAGDQLPDDFSFTSQSDVAQAELIKSNPITVTGIDSPVRIRLNGPRDPFNRPLFAYSKGCTDAIDGQDGDILNPGDSLCVVVQSAATDSTPVVVTVTIGGDTAGNQKSATFTVTTGDTEPDGFTFVDQVGVPIDATVYAEPITITGITAPAIVLISRNGQFQINCTGSYTSSAGLVQNGNTICVRQQTARSLTTETKTVLTVGGVSGTFTTVTTADAKPLPGSSGMDLLSLLLLAPLVGYRRRRRAD
jgi:uncharacterized delta-60 repeat protein